MCAVKLVRYNDKGEKVTKYKHAHGRISYAPALGTAVFAEIRRLLTSMWRSASEMLWATVVFAVSLRRFDSRWEAT